MGIPTAVAAYLIAWYAAAQASLTAGAALRDYKVPMKIGKWFPEIGAQEIAEGLEKAAQEINDSETIADPDINEFGSELFLPDEYYLHIEHEKSPLIIDANGNVKLYRAICQAEYDSLIKMGKSSSILGTMENKWTATNIEDATAWGNSLYQNGEFRIIEITLPKSLLDGFYSGGMKLDGIGPGYYVPVDTLNNYIDTIRLIK